MFREALYFYSRSNQLETVHNPPIPEARLLKKERIFTELEPQHRRRFLFKESSGENRYNNAQNIHKQIKPKIKISDWAHSHFSNSRHEQVAIADERICDGESELPVLSKQASSCSHQNKNSPSLLLSEFKESAVMSPSGLSRRSKESCRMMRGGEDACVSQYFSTIMSIYSQKLKGEEQPLTERNEQERRHSNRPNSRPLRRIDTNRPPRNNQPEQSLGHKKSKFKSAQRKFNSPKVVQSHLPSCSPEPRRVIKQATRKVTKELSQLTERPPLINRKSNKHYCDDSKKGSRIQSTRASILSPPSRRVFRSNAIPTRQLKTHESPEKDRGLEPLLLYRRNKTDSTTMASSNNCVIKSQLVNIDRLFPQQQNKASMPKSDELGSYAGKELMQYMKRNTSSLQEMVKIRMTLMAYEQHC